MKPLRSLLVLGFVSALASTAAFAETCKTTEPKCDKPAGCPSATPATCTEAKAHCSAEKSACCPIEKKANETKIKKRK